MLATEKRLIDANKIPYHQSGFPKGDGFDSGLDWAFREDIEKLPTVDAVEVVRARWVDNHCTACGMMPMGEELWKHMDIAPPRMECFMDYCPCCGAKMDRERKET